MVTLNDSDADKVLAYLRKRLEEENTKYKHLMDGREAALKSEKRTDSLLAQLADEVGFTKMMEKAHDEVVKEISQMILLLTAGSAAA